MRAEGPKERPTAVFCVQLSARYVQIRQTALLILHYYVRAFAHTYTCCASYSVVRHVYHGASRRRDRELNYSSQPIAKNQATMIPKAWISIGDSSLCGHLRRSSL